MDIKSFGAPPPTGVLASEREKTAAELRSESSFVRATPPQASPEAGQEEIKQGLVRMADYLRKFGAKKSKAKKKSRKNKTQIQRALSSYVRVAQSETTESGKGFQLSLHI